MIVIWPILLRHSDGKLYVFRGYNEIAHRFGKQIKVAPVRRRFGPIAIIGKEFFDRLDGYNPVERIDRC